ncbi:MAG: hypothetical protein HYU31_05285 [Deltaproteobacteria bacterium]|nr:hypothetical protein [Deltaproteobacteria bacterium]MBI2533166.1 hypothetical protein [Deltaproteobacteria bacterium]MBI3063904.1 hypothetical protein [Deltaproteobacteria bacterium]
MLNTMKGGMVLPLSTMPGDEVSHVFQGPMQAETNHFIEAVALDRPMLVTPEQARQVMEVTSGRRPLSRAQPTGQPSVGELRHLRTADFGLNPKFDIDYCKTDQVDPRQNKRRNCLVGEYNLIQTSLLMLHKDFGEGKEV